MMRCSDGYSITVCKQCGAVANGSPRTGYTCRMCVKNAIEFAPIEIPYAAKLLAQELRAMCIQPAFKV